MNPATFRKLAALGLTTEQVAGVLEIMSSDAEERNEKARSRWRKWKANQPANVGKRLANVGKQLTRGVDSSSKKVITEEDKKKDTGAAEPHVSDLDAFKAELSPILDAERIEALVAVRRKKGATITANTGKLLATAIKRCPVDPAEVADEMALRNWTSVKPSWLENKVQTRSGAPPGKRMNAVEALMSNRTEQQHGPESRRSHHDDVELLPADEPGLPALAPHIRAVAGRGFG